MENRPLIIVAIGGNGICPPEPGAEMSFTAQLIHTKRTIWNLISLFSEFQVIITHGNGPQAGLVYDQMIPSTPFGVITRVNVTTLCGFQWLLIGSSLSSPIIKFCRYNLNSLVAAPSFP